MKRSCGCCFRKTMVQVWRILSWNLVRISIPPPEQNPAPSVRSMNQPMSHVVQGFSSLRMRKRSTRILRWIFCAGVSRSGSQMRLRSARNTDWMHGIAGIRKRWMLHMLYTDWNLTISVLTRMRQIRRMRRGFCICGIGWTMKKMRRMITARSRSLHQMRLEREILQSRWWTTVSCAMRWMSLVCIIPRLETLTPTCWTRRMARKFGTVKELRRAMYQNWQSRRMNLVWWEKMALSTWQIVSSTAITMERW